VKNVENLRRFARKLPVSSIRRILLRNSFGERIAAGFVRLSPKKGIDVIVVSFGFKHGIPIDADLVF